MATGDVTHKLHKNDPLKIEPAAGGLSSRPPVGTLAGPMRARGPPIQPQEPYPVGRDGPVICIHIPTCHTAEGDTVSPDPHPCLLHEHTATGCSGRECKPAALWGAVRPGCRRAGRSCTLKTAAHQAPSRAEAVSRQGRPEVGGWLSPAMMLTARQVGERGMGPALLALWGPKSQVWDCLLTPQGRLEVGVCSLPNTVVLSPRPVP